MISTLPIVLLGAVALVCAVTTRRAHWHDTHGIQQVDGLPEPARSRAIERLSAGPARPPVVVCGHPLVCLVAERDGTVWCRACTRG